MVYMPAQPARGARPTWLVRSRLVIARCYAGRHTKHTGKGQGNAQLPQRTREKQAWEAQVAQAPQHSFSYMASTIPPRVVRLSTEQTCRMVRGVQALCTHRVRFKAP